MQQEEQIKAMLDKLDTKLEFDEGIAVDSVEELKTKYNEFVEELTANNEQPLMLQPQCAECNLYDGFGQCLEHGNQLFENCEDFEDNSLGLSVIPMTDEDWKELAFEKPHYSDDENIQKKFEFAVKHTGMGRVLSALCKELDVLELKLFIEEYFENEQLWTDYMED